MENRAILDLAQKAKVLLERHRASLAVNDVQTLEEVIKVLEEFHRARAPTSSVNALMKGAQVVARLLEFFEVID